MCTQEHCTFGPELGRIAKDDETVVFGVSCDSPFSHAAFRKQYGIPYDLLADPTPERWRRRMGCGRAEEPYNCTKRGTVIVEQGWEGGGLSGAADEGSEDGGVLEKAALIADELANRADEFGVGVRRDCLFLDANCLLEYGGGTFVALFKWEIGNGNCCPCKSVPSNFASRFCQAGLAGYSDRAMRLVARRRGCAYAVTEALLDVILQWGEGLRKSHRYQ